MAKDKKLNGRKAPIKMNNGGCCSCPSENKDDSKDKDQDSKRRDFIHDFYLIVASALVFLLAQTVYNAALVIFQAIFGPDIENSVTFQIFFVILVAVVVFTILISRGLFFNLF